MISQEVIQKLDRTRKVLRFHRGIALTAVIGSGLLMLVVMPVIISIGTGRIDLIGTQFESINNFLQPEENATRFLFSTFPPVITLIGIYGAITYTWLNQFKKEYGNKIIKPILEQYESNVSYSFESDFRRADIKKLLLFQHRGNYRVKAYDQVTLTHNKKEYKMNEVELQEKSGDSTRTYFKGLILSTTFPVTIDSATLVYPQSFRFKHKVGPQVHLESTEFDQLFTIYSTNQRDARIHLKTHLMSRIIDFCLKNKRKKVFLSFTDNQIHLCLHTNKDLFRIRLNIPIDVEDLTQEIYSDFDFIISILDEINLRRV
jgi:hypothetical protein